MPHHQVVTSSGRDLFASFAPDERALLRWVAPRLDTVALEEIAAADYGYNVPEYLEELTELVHGTGLPGELVGGAGPVLSLTRWTTPTDRRGHLKRLFACTLLVRAVTADSDPVDSLAPLVDSAWELGDPARAHAARFVAWCRLNPPGDWPDDPSAPMFLTLALLLLAAETAASVALAAVLVEELAAVLADPELPWRRRPRSPLFARHTTGAGETRRLWSALLARCLADNPSVADSRLVTLGIALGGDTGILIEELRALFTTPA